MSVNTHLSYVLKRTSEVNRLS